MAAATPSLLVAILVALHAFAFAALFNGDRDFLPYDDAVRHQLLTNKHSKIMPFLSLILSKTADRGGALAPSSSR